MKTLLLILSLLIIIPAYSQVENEIFTGFSTSLHRGYELHNTWLNKFNLDRAFLCYTHKIDNNFSARILTDLSNKNILRLAYINYKVKNLNIQAGLIENNYITESEKLWNHRYILSSFQEQQNYNNISDIGINSTYKLNNIAINAFLCNVAGIDSTLRYGMNISVHFLKKVSVIFSIDQMVKHGITCNTFGITGSYTNRYFSIGGEFNIQGNANLQRDKNRNGYSVWIIINPIRKLSIFGRLDESYSNNSSVTDKNYFQNGYKFPWNFDRDGMLQVVGVEYTYSENIKLSLNGRLNTPADGELLEGLFNIGLFDFRDIRCNTTSINLNLMFKF